MALKTDSQVKPKTAAQDHLKAQHNYDVVILGAGASGLMCSATAGYQGKSVLVIDHAPKAAGKIRISGGGQCNFTNTDVDASHFICQNPHFVKSALSRYPSLAFIELVERHGLAYEEREQGKLFCQNRASDLIQILRTECDWAGVDFALNCVIKQVDYRPAPAVDDDATLATKPALGHYLITTSQGVFKAPKCVVATGALSFPKLKATDLGYRLAKQFGLPIVTTQPGLVPLRFASKWQTRFADLSGLSLHAKVSCGTQAFTEAILFTHQGLSGPGILQASNYWQAGQPIAIDLFPQLDVYEAFKQLKQRPAAEASLSKWLHQYWPKRLIQAWLEWFNWPQSIANAPDAQLKNMAEQLHCWRLYPEDTAGYAKAEVTLGGVDTQAISSKTFAAKQQPGLYFIGEVLDVTGHLGGYNFQWAWASGVACGLAL